MENTILVFNEQLNVYLKFSIQKYQNFYYCFHFNSLACNNISNIILFLEKNEVQYLACLFNEVCFIQKSLGTEPFD